MRTTALLPVLFLLCGCSAEAAMTDVQFEEIVPDFQDVAQFASSTSNEELTDNSCVCVENGNCASGTRVQWEMGHFERQNETCDWDAASKILECRYEQRFVSRHLALPIEGQAADRSKWVESPGSWSQRSITAKQITTDDGTSTWCQIQDIEQG